MSRFRAIVAGPPPKYLVTALLLHKSLLVLRKEATSIAHTKAEIQRLLAHQVAHGVVAQQAGQKRGNPSCLFERHRSIWMAIRSGEIGCAYQGKSHLDCEEYSNVDEISVRCQSPGTENKMIT